MLKQLQAWTGNNKDVDNSDNFESILDNSDPNTRDAGAGPITNIGANVESAIRVLRSVPELVQSIPVSEFRLIFQGQMQLQSGLGFSFTKEWSQYWVEVRGFYLSYRILQSSPEPLGIFPITFLIDPSNFINTSGIYDADNGISSELLQLEKEEYSEFSSRELHENVVKIVSTKQVVMCRCSTLTQKQVFLQSVQEELRLIFGDNCWQEKLNAVMQAQPVIKKHVFLQNYHMQRILHSLEVAGMISAASSMLASSAKKFQGLVTVDDNINGIATGPTTYFMVLFDRTLYWFRSSSSPSPESFVPLMVASLRFDDSRIRKGQWSFVLESPIRKLTITTRHAIALCEWFSAIREDIGPVDEVHFGSNPETVVARHGRALSTFSIMWKNISVIRKPNGGEEPLVNDDCTPENTVSHDISDYLKHVVRLRSEGYTFAEVLTRRSGVDGFQKFLTNSEDQKMLNFLFELKSASGAETERILRNYFSPNEKQTIVELPPAILARLSCNHSEAGDIPNEALLELENKLYEHFERIFNAVRMSEQFHSYVREQLQISSNPEYKFENESMKLILIVKLNGKSPQTVFLDPQKSTVTLGRDPSNDVVIIDKHVSRSHVRLTYSKEYMELHDLGSSTGVRVNGVQTQYCCLHPGDVITIGATEIEFALQEPKQKLGLRSFFQLLHRFGWNRSESDTVIKE